MALKELNPDLIVPAHCTGETFIAIAMQEMPVKIVRSTTVRGCSSGLDMRRLVLGSTL